MRKCYRCKVEKELSEFHKSSRDKMGHVRLCKKCEKAQRKARYERDKERELARSKKYHSSDAGKESYRKKYLKSKSERPDVYRARYITGNAIRSGKLIKQPCEVCGAEHLVEAHHDDYSKPLKVRWLCRKHHRQRHGQLQEATYDAERV